MGKARRGFTIVELLIVIVVIAILAAITIVAYTGIQERARQSAVQSAISQGVKKVLAYAAENADAYPANATAAGLTSGDVQYTVTSNNTVSPKGYCITATSQGLTYFQTSTMSSSVEGTCDGLLAWWPFNGNAKDASGNGVDGIVVGATLTTGASGAANTAYQLGETNMYINVGSPASFSVIPTAFTYSIWLARTGSSTNQWPQIMGSSDTHVNFGIRTSAYGNNPYFEWGSSPYSGSTFLSTGTIVNLGALNEWHNVTITYNGSRIRGYADGKIISTVDPATVRPTMASFSFTTGGSGWQGKIDDARVYNRALSDAEVETIYRVGAQ